MALFFLLPLFTALIGGYIFNKCTDEIGYLVGIFAAICIVLSLIFAPWQILVLLLIFTLTTTKKLLRVNEYKMIHDEIVKEEQSSPEKQKQLLSQPRDYEVEMIRKYQHMIY
jgi:uncharacterized membrane protein